MDDVSPPPLARLRSRVYALHDRVDGRASPYEFCRRILYGENETASTHPKWRVSPHTQIRPASRSATTTLDVSTGTNQFLLSGSKDGLVSIYDLWATRHDRSTSNVCHRPIQQASNATTGASGASASSTMAAVQWYPIDTGIFLTASASGTVSLWDTAAMVPVLNIQPFQFTEDSSSYALRCMHVSPWNGVLAATGSNGSATIKLLDVQSGAASHTLTPPQSGHGVTAVQWSPIYTHVLASCGGRNVYVWDIRRTAQPLATLDTEYRTALDHSKAIPLHQPPWRPRKESALNPVSATNLAFTETGQHLVTVCGVTREITVWDMFMAHAPVRQPHSWTNANGGTPLVRGPNQPLLLTTSSGHRQEQSTLIWVANGRDGMDAYALANDTSVGSRSKPVATLRGHLGSVRTAVATRAPHEMISAADDGLILVWNRESALPQTPAGTRLSSHSNDRKRTRLQDVDSW